jgi:hypothetical protein
VFTRSIQGWHLVCTLEQDLIMTALKRALVQRRPEFHHSDQMYNNYVATEYTNLLKTADVAISRLKWVKPYRTVMPSG